MTAREPLAGEDARRVLRRDPRPHLFNRRDDAWGGTLENRARLLLDAVRAVRQEWPVELPLFVRLSMTDWVEGGFEPDEAVAVCRMLLNDPHWPLHAAKTLQARDLAWPVQYERANIF